MRPGAQRERKGRSGAQAQTDSNERPAMGTIQPLNGTASVAAPAGSGFQKASVQILIIENRVSRLTASAMPTIRYWPASRPARTRLSLAKKPESGGSPASDRAGTRKSAASQGRDR